MKFNLTVTGDFYQVKDEKEVVLLKELGFKFKELKKDEFMSYSHQTEDDDNDEVAIEINSLEELIEFTKKYGRIVLS